MEEDVEIELLYKTHGQMLMEAASTEHAEDEEEKSKVCGEGSEGKTVLSVEHMLNDNVVDKIYCKRKSRRRKEFNVKQKSDPKMIYSSESSTDVEELLDSSIVSYVVRRRTSSFSESDIDDISSSLESIHESQDCINEIVDDEPMLRIKNLELPESQVEDNTNVNSVNTVVCELQHLHSIFNENEDVLGKIERKLLEALSENEGKLKLVREEMKVLSLNPASSKVREPSFTKCFYKKFGIPYFHDSSGFPAPPNNDFKRKVKNGELIITQTPKLKLWKNRDKDKLQDAINFTLIEENSDKLVKEIKKLKCMLDNVSDEQTERQIKSRIVECQNQLKKVQQLSFSELVGKENSNREYDWLKYSASDFEGSRSSEECRRFWHLYFNPVINKGCWKQSEDEKLKKIAEEMNCQDWESIAKSLGTNRTAYQCLIHYRTRLFDKKEFSVGKWTKEEDEKLLNVINSAKVGDFIPWSKVSSYMGDRNHNQIYNRYVNCLDPKLVKGRFSTEEDLLIVSGVEVFGASYKEIASLMNNRTAYQIRERYERHLLVKTKKTGSFSLEEDEQLLKLVDKHGEKNFSLIADEMKTRSRTQVRQRYNCIMQMVRSKPGWTPAQVKRRNNHKISKKLTKTHTKVEKLRREVERIEKTFHLTRLESDVLRIEKLKELRDSIYMKKYDLGKCKRKTMSENSETNSELLEFFKYQPLNNPVKSSTRQSSLDNTAYLNEIFLLAKYFGHDLQLPESEEEIWENKFLSPNLKTFLLETLKMQAVDATCDKNKVVEISVTPVKEPHNIDYVKPAVDDTLIMEERWHDASIKVSNFNFSEFFKRTVFDYSIGMHQDIWNSKIIRSGVAAFNDSIDIENPTTCQQYFCPPNSITALGYKSILLSKSRLKREYKNPHEEYVKTENSIMYHFQDKFQETLLSLFYCAKVISVTDIASTLLTTVKSKTSSSQSVTNHEGLIHLLNNCDQNTSDIVRKVAKPIKDEALQMKKMKNIILEHNKTRQRQLKEYKNGLTYNRKMSIEHLVKNSVGRKSNSFSNIQVKKTKKWIEKEHDSGLKAKESSDSSNSLKASNFQKNKDCSNNKVDNGAFSSFKIPMQTYARTRQSTKRLLDSDNSLEPPIKKSTCMKFKNTEYTQPLSQEAENMCIQSHSRANPDIK